MVSANLIEPDLVGSHLEGLAIHFCFVRFIGGVENDDLAAAAACPEAVELAVNAFEAGEQRGEFFQPFASFCERGHVLKRRGWQAGRLPHYQPGSAFDVVNGAVSDLEDFPAIAEEGVEFFEDG